MLTRRQAEVLRLLAEGHTYREIGEALRISTSSVKSEVSGTPNFAGILERLKARNTPHAVSVGYRRGILRLPIIIDVQGPDEWSVSA